MEIDLYRRVYAAVREAELPEIPPGFALRMEQAVFAPDPASSAPRDLHRQLEARKGGAQDES